jgi:hypothetical protein
MFVETKYCPICKIYGPHQNNSCAECSRRQYAEIFGEFNKKSIEEKINYLFHEIMRMKGGLKPMLEPTYGVSTTPPQKKHYDH